MNLSVDGCRGRKCQRPKRRPKSRFTGDEQSDGDNSLRRPDLKTKQLKVLVLGFFFLLFGHIYLFLCYFKYLFIFMWKVPWMASGSSCHGSFFFAWIVLLNLFSTQKSTRSKIASSNFSHRHTHTVIIAQYRQKNIWIHSLVCYILIISSKQEVFSRNVMAVFSDSLTILLCLFLYPWSLTTPPQVHCFAFRLSEDHWCTPDW